MKDLKFAILLYSCLVITAIGILLLLYKKGREMNLSASPLIGFSKQAKSPGVQAFTQACYAKITIPGSRLKFPKPDLGKYPPNVLMVSPAFFKIVPYRWLTGNPASLAIKGNVALTESQARKYFGPIPYVDLTGRTIIYNDTLKASVSGIVADPNKPDWPEGNFVSADPVARH